MRGGVLADTAPASRISHPHDFLTNERHFGMLHLDAIPPARRAKPPYRATRKPRSWIQAHHDLAQMLNPTNPSAHMEAFAKQAAAAAAPQPTKTYKGTVDSFYRAHPSYTSMPMETAYFLEKAGISPSDQRFFTAFHTFTRGFYVLDKRARADLKDVARAMIHRSDPEERPRLEELYAEAVAPFHHHHHASGASGSGATSGASDAKASTSDGGMGRTLLGGYT